jgi:hypothetical protein
VTVLAPVRAVGDKGPGWQVSLSCSRCQEYGSCPKKQEPAVRRSRVHPTELACLQELLKRLQDRHEKTANKVALEAEKERDAAETAVEELKRQLQPKRARTDDDAGDAHEMLVNVDDAGDAHEMLVKDTDPSPVDQISWSWSWCKVVRAPSRPFGQKTNLLSHHHQGFGIVT